MPRKPKFDPKKAAAESVKKTAEDTRRRLLDAGIQEATRRQYHGLFVRMEQFRMELGTVEWNKETFFRLLDQLTAVGITNAESWRAALVHCLAVEGKETRFLDSAEVRKATEGVALQARLNKEEARGTVTLNMMRDLVTLLAKGGQHDTANFAIVIYECQLRSHEAGLIRAGDFYEEGRAKWLMVRKDKRQNRKNTRPRSFEKIIPEKGYMVLQQIAAEKKHGQELFLEPKRLIGQLSRGIKEAARIYKWPTGVKWDGAHILRHGGTRPIVEQAARTMTALCVNQTPQTIRHYARSLKEREVGG